MSGTGYSKFFWSDWRSDPKLRMCSLAARGLWIDMLSLMAEAKPKGELRVGNKPMTTEQLATLIGSDLENVLEAFSELEKEGVFSRTKAGVVYSRRMVIDENRRRKFVEFGRMGGNPSLSSKKEKSRGVKGRVGPMVHPVPSTEEKPYKRFFFVEGVPEGQISNGGDDDTPEEFERRKLKVEAAKRLFG